ncbi:MAG: WYL domain-containing protein [Chloroflexaceae bacterium]|nr:WYL domain-containing protein [Chloroflexaceae bacterium]
MSRKGQSITLSLSPADKARLEALAVEFGQMWGERPNISKLIAAIAQRQLQIGSSETWSSFRLQAFQTALQLLLEQGFQEEAQEIAWLLSSRSELSAPLRSYIEQLLNSPLPPWRTEIERLIRLQQSFRLSYRDPTDRLCNHNILYGQSTRINGSPYLLCRCEESGEEVPGLEHNWRLRLDRIADAVIVPLNRPWLHDLERIAVELELRGSLAFAYQRQQEDITVSELEGDPPARRIVRKIGFSSVFFDDIAKYWQDCWITFPLDLRDR